MKDSINYLKASFRAFLLYFILLAGSLMVYATYRYVTRGDFFGRLFRDYSLTFVIVNVVVFLVIWSFFMKKANQSL